MDQLHGLGGLGAHLPVDTLDKFGQGLFVGGKVEPVPPDHVQLFRGEGLWGGARCDNGRKNFFNEQLNK